MDLDKASFFEFLLRNGDNSLVLGHRTSEWCGVAPALEEDIALANIALDLIGQAKLWLEYAGEVEGRKRSADDLAFLRDFHEFRNLLMLELPNEDFGRTMMRQYFFDAYQVYWLQSLSSSKNNRIGEIASKTLKEVRYHHERSRDAVIALGDGTEESHMRMQQALDYLWPYAGEVFCDDLIDVSMSENGIAPLPSSLKKTWNDSVDGVLNRACLKKPINEFAQTGGKTGFRHTEYLGHMLATMQILQRSYPGAKW